MNSDFTATVAETRRRLVKRLSSWLQQIRQWPWRPVVVCMSLVVFTCLFVTVWSRAHLNSPVCSVLLRDRHHRFLGEVGGDPELGFGYWKLQELPDRVVAATLIVEDRRFWRHPGVDSRALIRAAWQNLSHHERISGASTLAMQVARMQNPGRRTYLRKGVEALTALVLTTREGREAVLRHYLEIVPYGNRIHGISYAARRYLDKPVADLSWAEVAFLTAIPQAPTHMNPFEPRGRDRAIVRGKRILSLLRQEGSLSLTEYELATTEISGLRVPLRGQRPRHAMHAVLAYQRLLAQPEHRATIAANPVVTTTIDLQLQREVAWKTLEAVDSWDHRGAGNGAVIVLDRKTREVLAWIGSTDYFDDNHAGAIDYARVSRSPGSTLKPFLYALALERGV
ncbi:MAG: glycosyl transferase, partial [bacterium]|nr:glycosyl transferase [bacterium]